MSTVERLADEISQMDPQSAGLLGAALMRALGIRLPVTPDRPPPPPPEPIDVQTSFTIWLDASDPARRVPLIREVRNLLGLGLIESRNFVDSLPQALAQEVTLAEAERISALFAAAGGAVRLI
jgi:large subunit ribosomal protein L7/L12